VRMWAWASHEHERCAYASRRLARCGRSGADVGTSCTEVVEPGPDVAMVCEPRGSDASTLTVNSMLGGSLAVPEDAP
jgi:hypothetical protein